jgi:hypothetical protein
VWVWVCVCDGEMEEKKNFRLVCHVSMCVWVCVCVSGHDLCGGALVDLTDKGRVVAGEGEAVCVYVCAWVGVCVC